MKRIFKGSVLICMLFMACGSKSINNEESNKGTYKYTSTEIASEEAKKKDIDFECMVENRVIRGSIRFPKDYSNASSEIKYPVVILSHGVLSNRNQGIIFIKLVDKLEMSGVISVRFDFDGCGESDGKLVNNSIKTECEDLKSVIEYVKTLNYIDNNNINLVGYSMGGAVTSIIAGEMQDSIKSVVLWAPAANIVDACREGKILLDNFIDINDLVEGNEVVNEEFSIGKEFFEEAINIDIYGEAKKYRGPVLILQGNKDSVIPMSYSEKYDEVYENSRLVVIKNGEHIFSGEQLDEVISLTSEFISDEN